MFLLATPAFVLLGKGEEWQIGQVANDFALHPSLSEPGLIESRTFPDIVKLSSQILILQLTQRCRLHRFHIFIPVKSLHPGDLPPCEK
jgi:hypothetical protein